MKNDDYLIQKYLRSRIKPSRQYPYCWEWLGSFNGPGYGQFKWNGEYKLAHREAYYQKYHYIPEGWVCHHRCSNKKCINPSHVVAIPHAENIRLAMKGRIFKRVNRGESNGNSKLMEGEVELIRDLEIITCETPSAIAVELCEGWEWYIKFTKILLNVKRLATQVFSSQTIIEVNLMQIFLIFL